MFFSQQSQQSQRSQSSFFCWARINRSNETSWVRDRRRRKIKLAAQKNCRKNWVSNYSHNLSLDVSKHTPDTHPTKNKHTHTRTQHALSHSYAKIPTLTTKDAHTLLRSYFFHFLWGKTKTLTMWNLTLSRSTLTTWILVKQAIWIT